MFYTYRQNNSGGSFEVYPDRGISVSVIIEAGSETEANAKAESIGLYFNGCDNGMDCDCCGDRWYDSPDAEEFPSHYGQDASNGILPLGKWDHTGYRGWIDGPEGYIHYKDGTIKPIDYPGGES